MFVSLEETDPDDFVVGNFTRVVLPYKKNNDIDVKINKISPKERETQIVQDLMYVLVGNEGIYITFEDRDYLDDIFYCLKGPQFKIHQHVDVNFRDIVNQLSNLGTKVYSLKQFLSFFNIYSYGKVMGRFCDFIRNFLKRYHTLIYQNNQLFQKHRQLSVVSLYQQLCDVLMESEGCSAFQCISQLYEITQTIIEESKQRFQKSNLMDMKFRNLMNSLKEDMNSSILDDIIIDSQNSKQVKGGALLNIVSDAIQKAKGNLNAYKFIKKLYEHISLDYVIMLNTWLASGKLSDPYDEFVISEDRSNAITYDSYYWTNKFAIKREMLLRQLSSAKIQRMLYFTGKYLRYIQECKTETSEINGTYNSITSLLDNNLELLISSAYERANFLFIQMLCGTYKFHGFINLMNQYFLMSDGGKFDMFLNISNHELKRSFSSASVYDIIKAYERIYSKETATTTVDYFSTITSVKFENRSFLEELLEIIKTKATDANDIMKAIDMGSLNNILKENIEKNTSPDTSQISIKENQRCNKLAISKLNVDIQIPFPINQIITESHKLEYQILFRHIAMIKFIEKRLEKSWRELGYQTFWTWGFEDIRVRKWIKRCRFIHTKMFDFLRLYIFYSKVEVIDINWEKMGNILYEFENQNYEYDVAKLKRLITEFLSSSMSDLLLSQTNLTTCLYEILTLIIVFHEYVMSARKVLLFLDETLMDSQRQKYNFSFVYSHTEKEKKLASLIQVLDSYHLTFQRKMVELSQNLSYYGGVDSPKLLILEKLLVSTFKL